MRSNLSTPAVEGKVVGATGRRSGQSDLAWGGKAADLGLDVSRLQGAVECQEVSRKSGNVAPAELAVGSIISRKTYGVAMEVPEMTLKPPWVFQVEFTSTPGAMTPRSFP
jgi:hypothetical protein